MAYKTCPDQMTLAGIKIYPRIGVTSEERQKAQECQVDLTLCGDFEAAAATDALEKSIDYCRVLHIVRETAEACDYNLVETLSYRIARTVLRNFPVSRVKIKVRKRPAELQEQLNFVEMEIEES